MVNRLRSLVFGSILVATACSGSTGPGVDGGGGGGGGAGGANCAAATTLAACTALADCHAVYTSEPRTPAGSCSCPDSGCCTQFLSCAPGAHATCSGAVLCKVVSPYCEQGYSVANNGTCYVGCVASSVCTP